MRQTSRNRFMLARVNGVYSNPPVLQNISGGKMAVPADVSQLTCATAASDEERRKVLPCFSRAGHRPKVGHKSFAHAHNLLKKTLHVWESCADCLLEKASEKTKRYLIIKKKQFNTSVLDSKHWSVRGKKITTSSGDSLSRAKLTRTQRCILPSERACDDLLTIKVKRQMTDSRVKEEAQQLEGGDVGYRWKYKQCDTFTKQCNLSSDGRLSFEFRALIRRTNEPKWICFNELACLVSITSHKTQLHYQYYYIQSFDYSNSYKANQKLTPLIKLVVSYSQINTLDN